MYTSPRMLEKSKVLGLAVKYSTHPPAHWIHKKVWKQMKIFVLDTVPYFIPIHFNCILKIIILSLFEFNIPY